MKKQESIQAWSVIFWLGVWHLASRALEHNSSFPILVSPIHVLYRLAQLALTRDFWGAICFSLLRIATGFFLATGLAILLAIASAAFQGVRELLAPVILTIKTIPVASFIILALILFSSRNLSALISFLMVFPIIYTNVLTGIRETDKQLLEMGKVFGLSPGRTIRYLYLPQVMPFFRSGSTLALGLCWKAGIAAELIGLPDGSVGEHLQKAKIYLDTADLFAWTFVIILVSMLFEKLVLRLMDRISQEMTRM